MIMETGYARLFCGRRLYHWLTSLTIPVRPPHASISKPLLFPNLHSLLNLLQSFLSGAPGSLSMRRGHRDIHAFLANIDFPEPMRHRYRNQLMLFSNGFGD
jgi:hypothetical protein